MKVYISLPITGRDIERVRVDIDYVASRLREQGHEPVSPLEINADNLDAPYAELLGNDIRALLDCKAIVLLDGWKNSKGCRLEKEAATIYGLELYTFCLTGLDE